MLRWLVCLIGAGVGFLVGTGVAIGIGGVGGWILVPFVGAAAAVVGVMLADILRSAVQRRARRWRRHHHHSLGA